MGVDVTDFLRLNLFKRIFRWFLTDSASAGDDNPCITSIVMNVSAEELRRKTASPVLSINVAIDEGKKESASLAFSIHVTTS